jgi:hypothetical protein
MAIHFYLCRSLLAGGCISQPANFAAFFSILLKIKRERVQIHSAKNGAWKKQKRVMQQYLFVKNRCITKFQRRVPTERTECGMQWSGGERRRHGPARSESKDAGKMKMGRWQGM